jgi:hypothetical protein
VSRYLRSWELVSSYLFFLFHQTLGKASYIMSGVQLIKQARVKPYLCVRLGSFLLPANCLLCALATSRPLQVQPRPRLRIPQRIRPTYHPYIPFQVAEAGRGCPGLSSSTLPATATGACDSSNRTLPMTRGHHVLHESRNSTAVLERGIHRLFRELLKAPAPTNVAKPE